ncbi:M15 family metallopeptidase [Chromobacterium haemolyticum]|uniref:M15 family metallopeptidase n=2 Tax=Chromobacterium fluminis TaxID=3044269 RepID=A0ABX0L2S8_9NEIS|nr:M15 family metallopeptidase [Chromobacterium haemolyticum]
MARSEATPVVVTIPEPELSGMAWVERYPGSNSLSELEPAFQANVRAFIDAMMTAGARIRIASTYRPEKRAYLMHWSYKIAKKKVKPNKADSRADVPIMWDHGDEDRSINAAIAMANYFQTLHLGKPPALRSRHTARLAIDMNITWTGSLIISNKNGERLTIESTPRMGMNKELHIIGASYGVIKFKGGAWDKPHWSSDGR